MKTHSADLGRVALWAQVVAVVDVVEFAGLLKVCTQTAKIGLAWCQSVKGLAWVWVAWVPLAEVPGWLVWPVGW